MKQLGSVVTDFSKGYVCLKFNVEKSCFLPQFFVVSSFSYLTKVINGPSDSGLSARYNFPFSK